MNSYVNEKENNEKNMVSQLIEFINKSFDYEEKDSTQIKNYRKLLKFMNENNFYLNSIDAKALFDEAPILNSMVKAVKLNRIYFAGPLKELEIAVSNYDCDFDFEDDEELEETDSMQKSYASKKFTTTARGQSVDGTGDYLSFIGAHSILTKEEEYELFERLANGDESAREKIIEHNLKLVVAVARKYINKGVELDDLIQEGNDGLMTAVSKFDHTRGIKFSTYAVPWIKQKIQRYICDRKDTIRIPVHMAEVVYRVRKANQKYITEYGRKATDEELAREANCSVEKIKFIKSKIYSSVSLSTPVNDESDETLDMFVIDEEHNLEEEAVRKIYISEFMNFFNSTDKISEREKQILYQRYCEQKTLEEIGALHNITRERIRQIEGKALRKLSRTSFVRQMTDVKYEERRPYERRYVK